MEDARFRYAYTAQGQVESVSDSAGQPIATYRYNSLGQRVAKTVHGVTTYTLWQAGNRVAEIDGDGNIQAQYLYLAEGQRSTPIAKLAGEQTYYIHADHRGAPLAMTDAQQAIVWRANVSPWGTAQTTGPASLNLRLPGQYYDEETGLHDNWHRTYDPSTGRYLQPDPLGYPDGPDAYLYVSGDPVNRVDSMGLYAEDVHYYMTYFLALLAGIDAKQARVIAMAAQTIDNVNPYTDAFPSLAAGGNLDARERYHFTQDGFDPEPGAGDILYTTEYDPNTGMEYQVASYSSEYQLRRLSAWNNTQIQTLHGYAVSAGDQYGACMKGQFYGEYLHALEDVFGHRKANNDPYGATQGHWYDGTNPDMTYNDGAWQNNEQRTLEMERVVFERLQSDFGREATDKDGFPIQFSDIEGFLRDEWNKETSNAKKMTMLDSKLSELLGKKTEIPPYEKLVGLGCRLKYLRDAHLINADGKATSDAESQYPGAILETKTEGAAECSPPQ